MGAKIDLRGQRFGRLLVLEDAGRNNYNLVIWRCKCDCSNTVEVVSTSLRSGNTKSCGCLLSDTSKSRKTTHNLSKTIGYSSWENMRQRCNNPEHTSYSGYGGRGITYDPKWETFEGFYEDMGERPSIKHVLCRIDNDENYCRENCVWSTDKNFESFNQRMQKSNTSGKTGVSWCNTFSKWVARIGVKGKTKTLGYFHSFEDAVKVREDAELKYYGKIKK